MKAFQYTSFLALLLCLTVGVSGCRKKPQDVTALPGQSAPYVGDGGTAGLGDELGGGGALGDDQIAAADPAFLDNAIQDREAFASYAVYFDFDSSLVKSSEQGKVSGVAGALNENTSNGVLIEGHCDERGTEGYNLALGERRALALREALVAAGVSAARIHTLSYGEERPADPGTDEVAYSKNRRGEFILLVP
jgi:peptidoglycan-associated lipoprotein